MNVYAVAGSDGTTRTEIKCHRTPRALYDVLVQTFGETTLDEHPEISWVVFGAGAVSLTFWPDCREEVAS